MKPPPSHQINRLAWLNWESTLMRDSQPSIGQIHPFPHATCFKARWIPSELPKNCWFICLAVPKGRVPVFQVCIYISPTFERQKSSSTPCGLVNNKVHQVFSPSPFHQRHRLRKGNGWERHEDSQVVVQQWQFLHASATWFLTVKIDGPYITNAIKNALTFLELRFLQFLFLSGFCYSNSNHSCNTYLLIKAWMWAASTIIPLVMPWVCTSHS